MTFNRIVWPLLIGAVLYIAYAAFRGTMEQLMDVQEQATKGPSIGEQILSDRDFFFEEFAQRQLVQLKVIKDDLVSVARIPEPRPALDEIRSRYGEPDRIEETKLTRGGVNEDVTIYHYGRLGLAIPKGRQDGKVFWAIVY
jgi:hypothetical protein